MIKTRSVNLNPKVYPLYSEPTPNPASSSSTIYHILPTTYSKAFTPLRPRLRRVKVASPAFTIVELLVTIAVIGILVSITVVSYTAIITKVASETLKQDLNEGASQLKKYYYDHGAYPASLTNNCPSSDSSDAIYCLKPSSGDSYSYTSSSPNSIYCLSSTKSSQSYFVTQAGTQLAGPCPVLYLDAGITASYPGAGTIWYDLSGNGNDVSLVNGATFTSDNGGSLSFNGVNQYGSFTSTPQVAQSTLSSTVEIIAYRNDPSRFEVMFGGGLQSNNNGYYFGFRAYDGNFMLAYYGNDQDGATGKTNVSWNDYVGIHNNSATSRHRYFNGTLLSPSQNSGVTNSSSNKFYIAAYNDNSNPNFYFKGKIAVVKIYNVVLTPAEITQNYNDFKSRFGF